MKTKLQRFFFRVGTLFVWRKIHRERFFDESRDDGFVMRPKAARDEGTGPAFSLYGLACGSRDDKKRDRFGIFEREWMRGVAHSVIHCGEVVATSQPGEFGDQPDWFIYNLSQAIRLRWWASHYLWLRTRKGSNNAPKMFQGGRTIRTVVIATIPNDLELTRAMVVDSLGKTADAYIWGTLQARKLQGDELAHAVHMARAMNTCRICGIKRFVSLSDNPVFLDTPSDHAHEQCLKRTEAELRARIRITISRQHTTQVIHFGGGGSYEPDPVFSLTHRILGFPASYREDRTQIIYEP